MEPMPTSQPDASPEAAAVPSAPVQPVRVSAGSVHIDDLTIDRAAIVEYLQTIAPDKQAIALVHVLEVGVTELFARRERFRH